PLATISFAATVTASLSLDEGSIEASLSTSFSNAVISDVLSDPLTPLLPPPQAVSILTDSTAAMTKAKSFLHFIRCTPLFKILRCCYSEQDLSLASLLHKNRRGHMIAAVAQFPDQGRGGPLPPGSVAQRRADPIGIPIHLAGQRGDAGLPGDHRPDIQAVKFFQVVQGQGCGHRVHRLGQTGVCRDRGGHPLVFQHLFDRRCVEPDACRAARHVYAGS